MTAPASFEQEAAIAVHTLKTWLAVLSVALMLVLGLAIYGFSTASGARDTAGRVARQQARIARSVASIAARHASVAEFAALVAVQRLQAEAQGECYRVNYLRWQIDHASYAGWRRDYVTTRFLHRLPDPSLRAVARAFHAAARSWHFLPLTDCHAATSSPSTYRAPVGVPFNEVPPGLLALALASPPQPPRP